jgi:hypothetical protein
MCVPFRLRLRGVRETSSTLSSAAAAVVARLADLAVSQPADLFGTSRSADRLMRGRPVALYR